MARRGRRPRGPTSRRCTDGPSRSEGLQAGRALREASEDAGRRDQEASDGEREGIVHERQAAARVPALLDVATSNQATAGAEDVPARALGVEEGSHEVGAAVVRVGEGIVELAVAVGVAGEPVVEGDEAESVHAGGEIQRDRARVAAQVVVDPRREGGIARLVDAQGGAVLEVQGHAANALPGLRAKELALEDGEERTGRLRT